MLSTYLWILSSASWRSVSTAAVLGRVLTLAYKTRAQLVGVFLVSFRPAHILLYVVHTKVSRVERYISLLFYMRNRSLNGQVSYYVIMCLNSYHIIIPSFSLLTRRSKRFVCSNSELLECRINCNFCDRISCQLHNLFSVVNRTAF